MRHLFDTGSANGRPASMGARFAAFLCLLIVAVASTAQAVHVHGGGLPDRKAAVGQLAPGSFSGDEAACPLCVAMHSALPVAVGYAVVEVVIEVAETTPGGLPFVAEPQHFAGFSRPPPVSILR